MNKFIAYILTILAYGVGVNAHADIWVVTNSANSETLDMAGVKDIFKVKRQQWKSGAKIVLVLPDDSSAESKVMRKKLYGLSKRKFKKFWLEKVYRGEIPGFPEKKNAAAMKVFIKNYPYSIGIVDAANIDSSMKKIVKLD